MGVLRFSGTIDGDTILRALDALYEGETWAPCFNEVWDCRPVSRLAVEPADVTQIVARMDVLARRLGAGQTAVIAPGLTAAHFACMLLVRSTCMLRQRKVFARLEDALDWLMQAYPSLKQGARRHRRFPVASL